MGDFLASLGKMANELSVLSGDIRKMAMEKSKEKDKKKDFKDVSLKSLQPTIKMYGSKEEAKSAGENKEIEFIHSQLKKIFG